MTDEIAQAFGPLDIRAGAMIAAPVDRISLRDHIIEVEIGAFQEERGRRQRLAFNIVVEVAPLEPPFDDDVDRILSYDTITGAIAAELGAGRINLLETLAGRIAARILAAPQARRVFARIEKLDRGPGALGVEIVRSRADLPPAAAAPRVPARVVFLSADAVLGPRLGRWLDELASSAAAVVLMTGAPARPAPRADAALAQRRIDLLALEQQAWVLAGRDSRCLVVGSRTELDWAIGHRRIVVWAPSKLVLDSPRGGAADPADPPSLALWLAREIGAGDLLLVGAALPQGRAEADTPPVRALPVSAETLG